MKEIIKNEVLQSMIYLLRDDQYEKLKEVLDMVLVNYKIEEVKNEPNSKDNQHYVESFLSSKRLEGCSEKTLHYYKSTIEILLNKLEKNVKHITTDDLRKYLTDYQNDHKSSRVTIDNIRRILASLFSWHEGEDNFDKSPDR